VHRERGACERLAVQNDEAGWGCIIGPRHALLRKCAGRREHPPGQDRYQHPRAHDVSR